MIGLAFIIWLSKCLQKIQVNGVRYDWACVQGSLMSTITVYHICLRPKHVYLNFITYINSPDRGITRDFKKSADDWKKKTTNHIMCRLCSIIGKFKQLTLMVQQVVDAQNGLPVFYHLFKQSWQWHNQWLQGVCWWLKNKVRCQGCRANREIMQLAFQQMIYADYDNKCCVTNAKVEIIFLSNFII